MNIKLGKTLSYKKKVTYASNITNAGEIIIHDADAIKLNNHYLILYNNLEKYKLIN